MWKIIDKYILKGFLPIFVMAFMICWFIVVMQFLWMYLDELVGKGLGLWVVGQIIFYAAMSFVPMALPLGILLASLIFFGNIGERLELLAMKAAGISLYRILLPLFTIVVSLAIGLFVFENTYMIRSQVRMWTLIYSAKSAALELEIPEGAFYNGIPGYSIFVKHRDKKHKGRMEDVMIYDFNGGLEKTRIIRADSGRIAMNKDKTFITWRLYNGQSFQNLEENIDYRSAKPIPHARERFDYKEILVPFNANFKKQDDQNIGSLYVGKNLNQLELVIDSAAHLVDSIRTVSSQALSKLSTSQRYNRPFSCEVDTLAQEDKTLLTAEAFEQANLTINPDSIFKNMSLRDSLRVVRSASSNLSYIRSDASNSLYLDKSAYHTFRTNSQEWHRKFTFPVSCLVFFLIGAPLGAIIRKGGLGMPVVISVFFFIVYYIIDTLGNNLVRSESISVELGMWLSTIVLLPIGLFLTYQAVRDSSILNADAYANFFRKFLGLKEERKYVYKDIIIEEADYQKGKKEVAELKAKIIELLHSDLMKGRAWRLMTISKRELSLADGVADDLENLVNHLSNTKDIMLNAHLRDLPVLKKDFAWFFPQNKVLKLLMILMFPVSGTMAYILEKQIKHHKNSLSVVNALLDKIDLRLDSIIESQKNDLNEIEE